MRSFLKEDCMRKVILLLVLLFVAMPAFSQVDAYLGVGRMLTSTEGNAVRYSNDFETNYNLGARWYATEKLSLNLNVMRDTARIGEYLFDHNYITKAPVAEYAYTKIRPSVEYWFGDLYVFAGLPVFVSPSKDIASKMGYEAGAGIKHKLYKSSFWQSEASFIHVQDFIVPVANTVNLSFMVGYSW
jgi:hypothetical protein